MTNPDQQPEKGDLLFGYTLNSLNQKVPLGKVITPKDIETRRKASKASGDSVSGHQQAQVEVIRVVRSLRNSSK